MKPLGLSDSFGIYKILKPLGEGGMGEVFLAEDTVLDRKVALKFLRRGEGSEYKILEQRFQNEAKVLASLNHPNIVSIYSYGKEQDLNFIVMEYVAGNTLQSKIKKGCSVQEAWSIFTGIIEGLQAAHEKGILHRDIKPANVVIDHNGKPKLVDFGISKNLFENSNHTRTDHFIGTLSYMAPELLRGLNPSASSDIFALGVVFYEMLSGKNPFKGENQFQTIEKIKTTQVSLPQSLSKQLPDMVHRIFDKMVAIESSNRYQSALDLLNDMNQVDFNDGSKTVNFSSNLLLGFSDIESDFLSKGYSKSDIHLLFQFAMDLDSGKTDFGIHNLAQKTLAVVDINSKKVSNLSLKKAEQIFLESKKIIRQTTTTQAHQLNQTTTTSSKTVGIRIPTSYERTLSNSKERGPVTRAVTKTVVVHKNKSSIIPYAVLLFGLFIIVGYYINVINTGSDDISFQSAIEFTKKITNFAAVEEKLEQVPSQIKEYSEAAKKSVESQQERSFSSNTQKIDMMAFPSAGSEFQFIIKKYYENSGSIISRDRHLLKIDSIDGAKASASMRSNTSYTMLKLSTNVFYPPIRKEENDGTKQMIQLKENQKVDIHLEVGQSFTLNYSILGKNRNFFKVKRECKVHSQAPVLIGEQGLIAYIIQCEDRSEAFLGRITFYYSPKLGYFVKKVERQKSNNEIVVTEMMLENYKLP